jgi:murein DD-endopeptidase MepM/ murein hydrolase activator NlpD
MKFKSCLGLLLFLARAVAAQPFQLPTANQALFEPAGQDRYFVPTPGKTWLSGAFGCVRSDGWQMHEGLDVKCLQRDRAGEPVDPVLATADGVVAYINNRPALSNYGRYIVLLHRISGMEIYSLYAHLSEIQSGLRAGRPVRGGEQIAVMGRTSNTRERISKERAHVHFELNLFYSDHFNSWFKRHFPGERNDHGLFNGENLVSIGPNSAACWCGKPISPGCAAIPCSSNRAPWAAASAPPVTKSRSTSTDCPTS